MTNHRGSLFSTLTQASTRSKGTPPKVCRSGVLGMALALVALTGVLHAQAEPQQLVPFQTFLHNTQSASAADYTSLPASKVKDQGAFEEMRGHIMSLYQGVNVSHSFILDGDQFDCVAIEQQPSFRMQGLKSIATP